MGSITVAVAPVAVAAVAVTAVTVPVVTVAVARVAFPTTPMVPIAVPAIAVPRLPVRRHSSRTARPERGAGARSERAGRVENSHQVHMEDRVLYTRGAEVAAAPYVRTQCVL